MEAETKASEIGFLIALDIGRSQKVPDCFRILRGVSRRAFGVSRRDSGVSRRAMRGRLRRRRRRFRC